LDSFIFTPPIFLYILRLFSFVLEKKKQKYFHISRKSCTFAVKLDSAMTILTIETSTSACSAAIAIDGKTVASMAKLQEANHASDLPLFIENLLQKAKDCHWHLDAVALSQGPGSYTGLRIGASIAKGICYGLNIPLIPIDTLQVLCAAIPSTSLPENALLCPMLDARRMEVYTCFYKKNDQVFEQQGEVEAKIIDKDTFAEQLATQPVLFFGNGSEKCKSCITHPNAHFIPNIITQAEFMGYIAEKEASKKILDIKQIAYYEPFYLKEFVAAPSHIKGLK
jgi:tRNA threonylcarbamoyladenosine biosynthesis protein TsaB